MERDLKRIIYAAKGFRNRCILKTFVQTGIRQAELSNLDGRDIDFKRRLLQIREGKGSKERLIPITDELASDLKHLIGNRKVEPIFFSLRGCPSPILTLQ